MGGLTIAQLQLAPHVQANAESLRVQFGSVVQFVSGYRDLLPQARAMAKNTLLDRRWIEQTYTRVGRPSYAIGQQLQAWVLAHPEIRDVEELTIGIFGQLVAMPNGCLISRHSYKLNGQPAALAFDLEPIEQDGRITAMGQEVWDAVVRLPYLDPPPMRREAGLPRWHAQFNPIESSVSV